MSQAELHTGPAFEPRAGHSTASDRGDAWSGNVPVEAFIDAHRFSRGQLCRIGRLRTASRRSNGGPIRMTFPPKDYRLAFRLTTFDWRLPTARVPGPIGPFAGSPSK